MNVSKRQSWERFKKYYFEFPKLGLAVDLSRMDLSDEFFATLEPRIQKAFSDMAALESGAIANPDEGRMVGLRDKLRTYFFDNTDPDGMHRVLARIGPEMGQTLCLVVSNSGATKETRNGMLEAKAYYEGLGLNFGRHAAAITGKESELHRYACQNKWITTFPMWDWVGGRTSELSAVGLLPAALQGIDIDGMLAGARLCDEVTRGSTLTNNPSALLALSWFRAGDGKGHKSMVVIPYKDLLELFARYLQQLIMESLGKERDLSGTVVNQGICVFGNKGSTDQHYHIQQLRYVLNNFFVTFVEILLDQDGEPLFVGF